MDEKPTEGWHLTPEQQALFRMRLIQLDRQLVQPPDPGQRKLNDGRVKTINGIPVGDLVLIAALEQLAEQGNRFAARVVRGMKIHYGITAPVFIGSQFNRAALPLKPLLTIHYSPVKD